MWNVRTTRESTEMLPYGAINKGGVKFSTAWLPVCELLKKKGADTAIEGTVR